MRVFAVLFLCSLIPSEGRSNTAKICDAAAQTAASETDVPLVVLRSITRAETGRQHGSEFVPWPWTVNMEGAGKWFESEDTARAFVFRHFTQGARSFDVGCFQINYKWHGHAFASIEDMFDPTENARYAARFLSRLKSELGTWAEAVGAYHSRTPKYAKLYKARYKKIQAGLNDQLIDLPVETAAKPNQFPLLRKQTSAPSLGSLVPLAQSNSGSNGSTIRTGG